MTYALPTVFVVIIAWLFYEMERVLAPTACPRRLSVSLWCYRLAGLWCLVWLLFPLPMAYAQGPDLTSDVVRNQEQVRALQQRVVALEVQRLDARIAALENVPVQLNRLQTQVWGVLGGLVLLAAGQVFQLRRQTP